MDAEKGKAKAKEPLSKKATAEVTRDCGCTVAVAGCSALSQADSDRK